MIRSSYLLFLKKQAGLLKVPEKTVNEIFNWIKTILAARLTKQTAEILAEYRKNFPHHKKQFLEKYLEYQQYQKMSGQQDYANLMQTAEAYPDRLRILKPAQQIHQSFNINWSAILSSVQMQSATSAINKPIDVWFVIPESLDLVQGNRLDDQKDLTSSYSAKRSGEADADKITIMLRHYQPKSSESIVDYFADIKRIITHELSHAIQYRMKEILNLNQLTGLPATKLRNPAVSPSGMVHSQEFGARISHSLRDVEFYTKLKDAVTQYQWIATKVPIKDQPEYLKMYLAIIPPNLSQLRAWKEAWTEIGKELPYAVTDLIPSEFFTTLKNKAPEKWQKAIKEFYKAIQ